MTFTRPLFSLNREDLPLAGGKGANLGALIQAGLPVPEGFVITTEGYRAFVEANALGETIQRMLAPIWFDDPLSLEAASMQIRTAFQIGVIPVELVSEIKSAYLALSPIPYPFVAGDKGQGKGDCGEGVAVRSSATAEDLPDLSFAGQQDTYLNMVGEQAVLDAVIRCWSSLWTARAIGYRARNCISHEAVELAVVVQRMVASQASGVLFTANPLTGKRSETVIDATLGLGEALVSGQVEPDHYVVEDGRIVSKTLGAKALAIRGQAGGGTLTEATGAASVQALPNEQILALARLGRQAEAAFGGPQDVEWAFAADKLYIVQSRPVTSLYPLPEGMLPEPLYVLLSFGAVQGMLDPITPFGRDGIGALAVSIGNYLGYPDTLETQDTFISAGERLFINITPLLRNRIGRRLVPLALDSIEQGSRQYVDTLLADPRLVPGKQTIHPDTAWKLLRKAIPTILRMARTLLAPEWARATIFRREEAFRQWAEAAGREADTLEKRLDWMAEIFRTLPRFMFEWVIPTFAPGIASWNALNGLAVGLPDGKRRALEVTRGLPYNVTTEMDLALWETARAIRADAPAMASVATGEAAALAAEFQAGRLPGAAQSAVERFLARYGGRGVAEIDIGRVRWGENPTPVFQAIKSYVLIDDPDMAPDAVFRRSVRAAEAAVESLAEAARRQRGGWLKAHRLRLIARRVRALAGVRELPKFMAVRVMAMIRRSLLQSGAALAAESVIEQADDVFFLRMGELRQVADPDWRAAHRDEVKAKVLARRQAHEREKRRRQSPRILLSDGRAAYEGVADIEGTDRATILTGSPVSPGVVEGVVHVIFDPHKERMIPGEILVCPGTDPAWTPLFLAAGGLVMEVGGLMTHGSVVAREYGIPAVVGVSQATTRLKTGQRIRVDGSAGRVTIL